jgi:L-threonylcarbamoyladenylate synthase
VPEAAACLFETLHELDKSGASRIFAQFVPQNGLGEAINDRLTRAAG